MTVSSTVQRFPVTTLAGHTIELLSKSESDFWAEASAKYLSDFSFTLASDLRQLDRLLMLEVQMHRYQWYVLAGKFYDNVDLEPKDEVDLHRRMKELSPQIVEIQSSLGLSKKERDKASADSVGAYIAQLKIAAREHGINRENQMGKAIELTKQLFSIVDSYTRSSEEERRKLGWEKPEMILEWVQEYMAPEFNAIDEHFRKNTAKFYRRSL